MNEEIKQIRTKLDDICRKMDSVVERITFLEKQQNEENIKTNESNEVYPCKTSVDMDGNILFNDNKQCLEVNYDGSYNVHSEVTEWTDHKEDFVWVSCKREDLEVGDTAYRTSNEGHDLVGKERVCKILDGKTHIYVLDDIELGVSDIGFDYWYKLVRKDE